MKRMIIYVAHPLSGATREEIAANLKAAMEELAWLRARFPETTFIAPWIATVISLNSDDSPALREQGLIDDCAVIERCDGIAMTGPRVSDGMARELRAGQYGRWSTFLVVDITGPVRISMLPPAPRYPQGDPATFYDWAMYRRRS